jgi:hypothetical protein
MIARDVGPRLPGGISAEEDADGVAVAATLDRVLDGAGRAAYSTLMTQPVLWSDHGINSPRARTSEDLSPP